MRTIHKYLAQVQDVFELEVPLFSCFRHVESTRTVEFAFWFEVDTAVQEKRTYRFWVFGTGHEIPEDGIRRTYIKTVVEKSGLVWHIFVEGYLPT